MRLNEHRRRLRNAGSTPQTSLEAASSGQAMVEFTIIVMVFLTLIFGALQFALIYHAKTTLNYAAFETARAGSVNNARMWAMEFAFARAMAPLYTTPYNATGDTCNNLGLDALSGDDTDGEDLDHIPEGDTIELSLQNVICARQRVRNMVTDGYARILLVNPSETTFSNFGETNAEPNYTYIPNDSLMFRSAALEGDQSIQDANLIKVHLSFCYEMIVPVADRLIWRMIKYAPSELEPENFGVPEAGSFADACVGTSNDPDRFGIPIYAQAVMRMQSDAIQDEDCAGQCG